MAEFAATVATMVQLIVAVMVVVVGIFAILWVLSSAIEVRMKWAVRAVRVVVVVVVGLSLILLTSKHNIFARIGMVATNVLWLVFSVTGFPHMRGARLDVLGAIILTVLTHCALLIDALEWEQTLSAAIATFFLTMWMVPMGISATVIVEGATAPGDKDGAGPHTGVASVKQHIMGTTEHKEL